MIHLTEKQQKSRFLKGFFRFFGVLALVFFTQYKFDVTHLQHEAQEYMKNTFGDIGTLVLFAGYLAALYYFFYFLISGGYYMVTWEIPLPMYETKGGKDLSVFGNSAYPNINRVLKYREGKMGLMTNDQATQYLMQTSKLDNLYGSNGPNTKRTLDYIEGRIGLMSNDTAIDFISGKLK